VESTKSSRLTELVVYALALAIAWLIGQVWVGSSVLVIATQTSPWRFTIAPHMREPPKSPPAVVPGPSAGFTPVPVPAF